MPASLDPPEFTPLCGHCCHGTPITLTDGVATCEACLPPLWEPPTVARARRAMVASQQAD
jgi:hypothetical protein